MVLGRQEINTSLAQTTEVIMTSRTIITCALASSLFSILAVPQARSASLEALITTCEANQNCAHEQASASGSMLFKIKRDGSSRGILCQRSGECVMLLPRGQKYSMPDLIALIRSL